MNDLTIANSNMLAGGGMAIEQTRAIAEVQAAMVVAKSRPRNEEEAYLKIMKACERHSLAAAAIYTFKRGGQLIEGPSIRLGEVMARAWGNVTYGMRELSRESGVSEIEAFAWDLESNTRVTRQFILRHIRDKKTGSAALTEERDIYELAANMGQRRVRACLLELIPGDIVEEAVLKCKKVVAEGEDGEAVKDRVRKMLNVFEELGVSKAMIEAFVGHKAEGIVAHQLVKLTGIYKSIKDGIATREEFFDINAGEAKLNEQFGGQNNQPNGKTPPPKTPQRQNSQQQDLSYTAKILGNEDYATDPSVPGEKFQVEARKNRTAMQLDKWRAGAYKRILAEMGERDGDLFLAWVGDLYNTWKAEEASVSDLRMEV